MTDFDTVASLDVWDIVRRADRARNALLSSVADIPDEQFCLEPAGQWGVGRILRHVAWIEQYWTLTLERLCTSSEAAVTISQSEGDEISKEASRRSGIPEVSLAAPPPYTNRAEALDRLNASRGAFLVAVQALKAEHFLRRMSGPRGEVSLRFAVEHVIEHDWDHALQIAGLRS
jgi:uncharacterized damage-inducible protein DinB